MSPWCLTRTYAKIVAEKTEFSILLEIRLSFANALLALFSSYMSDHSPIFWPCLFLILKLWLP